MGIVFLQRCGGGPQYIKSKPIIDTFNVHDTLRLHDTVSGKPTLVWEKGDTTWLHDTLYAPSSSYDILLSQYDILGNKFFHKSVYTTPFSLGRYGTASVTDTIVLNQLVGSSFSYNINIPTEQSTITIHEFSKPTRQIYFGGGIFGNQAIGISGGFIGGLYKDRRDRIFGINIGYNPNGIVYGVSSYWKIKL